MRTNRLLAGALLWIAPALFAAAPSPRTETRMVYVPLPAHTILFGGSTAPDSGATKLVYEFDDTWEWTGYRWVQRFPATSPSARGSQGMVYETSRSRILLFGGRGNHIDQNDTWVYSDNNWTKINTPDSPSVRAVMGMAFDPIRDRTVVFGGQQVTADDKTTTPLYDTWEFDGTTWTQRAINGPTVTKPSLVYDSARNQLLLIALDSTNATVMYLYHPGDATWEQLKPATLPDCANEPQVTFDSTNNVVILTGGVCQLSNVTDETWTWDGTNWTKLDPTLNPDRVFGGAIAYDQARSMALLFGGTVAFGAPRSLMYGFVSNVWAQLIDPTTPGPRTLFALVTNPDDNSVWMFGGFNDVGTMDDFWRYQNGQWTPIVADKGPVGCLTPVGAYDSDRKKLVLVCSTSQTFEFDGTAWTEFTSLKDKPPARRFSSMAYDPTLKKTVLFGGYDDTNYLDQTWTWDGTTWTRVKKNPAPSRGLASMWYDPTLKKVVVYGGVGRVTSLDRITRYADMWSFSGSGWTQIKTTTPGSRYGAQAAVDPRTGHVILYGGLRLDGVAPNQTQVYANDTWEWNGSSWAQLTPSGSTPPIRENGGLAFDPSQNQMILFGGFAGSYFADLWQFDKNAWSPFVESLKRRRPGS